MNMHVKMHKRGCKGYASKRESVVRRFDAFMVKHPMTIWALVLLGFMGAGIIERAMVGR